MNKASHTVWKRLQKAPRMPQVQLFYDTPTEALEADTEESSEITHACFRGQSLSEIYDEVMFVFKQAPDQGSQFGMTKEIMNCFIEITNPRRRFVLSPRRKHSLIYLIGELVWYVSGERGVERIANYSKFWNGLVDKDGEVNSNYGHKIFHRLLPVHIDGRDASMHEYKKSQFEFVCDELRRDATSRRAVMMLSLSDEDYPKMHNTKDFPCTMYLHFIIRGGKLDLLVHMRSNDFILGFTNDMPFFSVLQELVAQRIRVPLGSYYHFSDSMHLYERNYDQLGYPPTPGAEWREEIFPHIEYEDLSFFMSWPTVETRIRESKGDIDVPDELPPFTKMIYTELVKHWKRS